MLFAVSSTDRLDIDTSGADGFSPIVESDKDCVVRVVVIVNGRPSLFSHGVGSWEDLVQEGGTVVQFTPEGDFETEDSLDLVSVQGFGGLEGVHVEPGMIGVAPTLVSEVVTGSAIQIEVVVVGENILALGVVIHSV